MNNLFDFDLERADNTENLRRYRSLHERLAEGFRTWQDDEDNSQDGREARRQCGSFKDKQE